ncbi:MAG: hypothetical protein H6Q52_2349 [Deltaproteobacteria bacterium]|nr:hypothetical protein [Deltaproteobacteria bacterium]
MIRDIKEIKPNENDILLIVEEKPARHIRDTIERSFVPIKKVKYEKEKYIIYSM